MSILKIERKVLEKNDEIAARNRELFKKNNLFVINIVSSPGAGKTTLLEKTIELLKDEINISVIEGDVQTDFDARRVAKYGVPVVQIVTNGGCHLEAKLVSDAASNMNLTDVNLLVIENVGNLVCPAGYDLGEDLKVVFLCTMEGVDKPMKYPKMILNSSVLVINKIDLLPYVNCNVEVLKKNALKINPNLIVFETSSVTGEGIEQWCKWIKTNLNK